MLIYKPGTEVTLKHIDVNVKITSVLVKPNDFIQYQCVWWDGFTRKEEWVCEFEIEGVYNREEKMEIGFHEHIN